MKKIIALMMTCFALSSFTCEAEDEEEGGKEVEQFCDAIESLKSNITGAIVSRAEKGSKNLKKEAEAYDKKKEYNAGERGPVVLMCAANICNIIHFQFASLEKALTLFKDAIEDYKKYGEKENETRQKEALGKMWAAANMIAGWKANKFVAYAVCDIFLQCLKDQISLASENGKEISVLKSIKANKLLGECKDALGDRTSTVLRRKIDSINTQALKIATAGGQAKEKLSDAKKIVSQFSTNIKFVGAVAEIYIDFLDVMMQITDGKECNEKIKKLIDKWGSILKS